MPTSAPTSWRYVALVAAPLGPRKPYAAIIKETTNMNDPADVKNVSTMTIVHPAAEEVRVPLDLAPRLTSLRGTKIGIIHNTKHMAGGVLTEMGRVLKEQYDVNEVESYRKKD